MTTQPRQDFRPGVTEPVVLMISRREVEAGDLASVLSRLRVFRATREDAWRYRGQMTLVVDGYNNDPRELVDVPQVRTLLCSLEAAWPFWACLFNRVVDSIKLLLSCAAGHRFLGRGALVGQHAGLVAHRRGPPQPRVRYGGPHGRQHSAYLAQGCVTKATTTLTHAGG